MSKKRLVLALRAAGGGFAAVCIAALLSTQAFAAFLEGKQAYDKADWISAIMNLRPLAEAGDARAAVLLGNMYLDGHGVAEDAVEAAGLYRKAALAHNTDGMVALAVLYQQGRGLDINVPVSRGWFERAARLGNQSGAFLHGILLFSGSKGQRFDYKPDLAGAYKWLKITSLYGPDKKLATTAGNMAQQIVVQKLITNDEMVAGDRESANWKPEMPESFPLSPEDMRLKELWAIMAKEREEQKITDPMPPLDKLPSEAAVKKDKKPRVSDKPKSQPPGGLTPTNLPPEKDDAPRQGAPQKGTPEKEAPKPQ